MVLKQNGLRFKYKTKVTIENIGKFRRITKSGYGYLKYNNQWHECSFDMFRNGKLAISPYGTIKDGMSSLGPVNTNRNLYEFKLNWFNRNYFRLKNFVCNKKYKLLHFYDKKLRPIKLNLILMFIVLTISICYYYINELFDDYLYKIISTNNLAQSIIIFFTLATVVSLVHPFSFKRDTSAKETRELISRNNEYLSRKNQVSKKIEAGRKI